MTDTDKLIEEYPLPWVVRPYLYDAAGLFATNDEQVPIECSSWADAEAIAALANTLHAEREKVDTLTRLRDAQAIRIRHLENRPTEDVIAALKASLTDAWKKLDAFEGRVREPDDGQPTEADCDLQHEPAHVEPGPHPSPRFGPASRPSVTDRLNTIEHRLAALEHRAGPFARPMPDHPSESP